MTAAGIFRQSGWHRATSGLSPFGLNTSNPLGEWWRGDKRVSHEGSPRASRRSPTRIHAAKRATGFAEVLSHVRFSVQIKKLPDIEEGTKAHLIIEILLRGEQR